MFKRVFAVGRIGLYCVLFWGVLVCLPLLTLFAKHFTVKEYQKKENIMGREIIEDMRGEGGKTKKLKRVVATGWFLVLFCTLLVYDALLFSSMNKEIWNNEQASAKIVTDTVSLNLHAGVRYGKKFETYQGMDRLLAQNHAITQKPLAALHKDGSVLLSYGDFPENAFFAGKVQEEADGCIIREDKNGRTVIVPVRDREGQLAGYVASYIYAKPIRAELFAVFKKQLISQTAIALAGLVLFVFVLSLWQKRVGKAFTQERFSKAVRFAGIFVFLLVMAGNGAISLYSSHERYTESIRNDAEKTGQLLTGALKRLLLVGMSFENMDNVDSYLAGISSTHNNTVALEILTPLGHSAAASFSGRERFLPDPQVFPLLNTRSAMDGDSAGANWKLRISLLYSAWFEYMRAVSLDLLTMVAVSLIFMVELFLLLMRGMEYLQQKKMAAVLPAASAGLHKYKSSLVRPIGFFMLFAMDMTISFIPLRMAELVSADSASRDMLLGLPISAEMGMTGISVLFAGYWIKRQGAKLSFMAGLACISLGYLGSMLAAEPWHFIVARGVVGTGYGLALLTAQAYTVKDSLLADMFAGVYAGSLCGSAMGAMLAERFGYAPVFLLSAFVLLCLIPMPYLLFKGETAQKGPEEDPAEEENSPKLTRSQICSLLGDRHFLGFILLSLIPSAIVCVGFLNYFLPVYLNDAGTSQSDIGRVYMLNCFIVIYSAPFFGKIVAKIPAKTGVVCAAGIVSACSLFVLGLFSPLMASLAGAVLIGLATGLNIPAQSEYLLQLDIARAIGIDQSMSLLDAVQRIGQVLGPICAGAVLLSMSIDNAAWSTGIAITAVSVLFLIVARPKN